MYRIDGDSHSPALLPQPDVLPGYIPFGVMELLDCAFEPPQGASEGTSVSGEPNFDPGSRFGFRLDHATSAAPRAEIESG